MSHDLVTVGEAMLRLWVPAGERLEELHEIGDLDAVDLAGGFLDNPPAGGSVPLPEPGTALSMLLAGALGLIRRR